VACDDYYVHIRSDRKQVVTSDPGIFVERINITKENIYGFCLNWHGKRIVINAKARWESCP
jgi:hypothetical protein